MTDNEIAAMSYDEKCKMLNSNPVVVAKHFQFRLEKLFKDLILSASNPAGKVQYYAIRIEFQLRGSPHTHYLSLRLPTFNRRNYRLFC